MEKLKIAVAFMRTANENQNEQNPATKTQRAAIEDYANKQGIKIATYLDNVANSGEETLNGVLGYCKSNPDIKYLIVSDSTRISRNLQKYTYWKARFKQTGVEIISVKNTHDTPVAMFMENLLQLFSQYDNQMRSEAVRRGLQRKKEQEARK